VPSGGWILVNNAGADFVALTEEDWQDGFALKFHGYVHTTRAAWPHLRESHGCIVNIVGVGSRAGPRIQELQDPAVVAFQDRVEAAGDPGMAADAAEVTITLKDGSRHACRIQQCNGSGSNPMTDEQLTRKFIQLAEPVVGSVRAKQLAERSWDSEAMADTGDLARAAA
jgi:NAD(P)-dependent dehydrogenase (short-subunit alcohol dehydrogenase family)